MALRLVGRKSRGPTIERKMDPVIMRATSLSTFAYSRPYLANWDVQRAVTDAFERVIWIYRGVDLIASSAAQLEIIWRSGDPRTGKLITSHPLLQVMNTRTSILETAEAFWYRVFSIYLLSKRGCFVEITRNRGGGIYSMTILPPHLTFPIPDWDTYTSAFRVNIPGGAPPVDVPAWENSTWDGGKWVANAIEGPDGRLVPDKTKDLIPHVVWVKKPHPIDAYSSITPLESAGISIDTDYYSRLYNRTFMQNDGRPGGIVSINGRISDEDAELIRRKMTGGQNAGRTAVIEAEGGDGKGGMSYVDLGSKPRDAQYVEGTEVTKTACLDAMGVDEGMIGSTAGRTFDNMDAAQLIFWQNTMGGHLMIVAGCFSVLDPDPANFMAFDTSKIGILQRDENAARTADAALVTGGLMSRYAFKKKWGDDDASKFNNPAGRALWVQATMVPIPQTGDDIEEITWGAPAPSGGIATIVIGPDGQPHAIGAGLQDAAGALPPAGGTTGTPITAVSTPVPISGSASTAASTGTDDTSGNAPKPKPKKPGGASTGNTAGGKKGAGPGLPGTADLPRNTADSTDDDDAPTGAMVALFLDPATAEQLVGDDPSAMEPAEDLHITLAFLGQAVAGDRDKVLAAVQAFASNAAPLQGTISGYGWFDLGDGDQVFYASPDIPDLPDWRQRLLATLSAFGVDVVATHGYTPHIATCYLSDDEDLGQLPAPTGLPLSFTAVTVAWGADRQSFSLRGEAKVARARWVA